MQAGVLCEEEGDKRYVLFVIFTKRIILQGLVGAEEGVFIYYIKITQIKPFPIENTS